jgi:hypothetical protein
MSNKHKGVPDGLWISMHVILATLPFYPDYGNVLCFLMAVDAAGSWPWVSATLEAEDEAGAVSMTVDAAGS